MNQQEHPPVSHRPSPNRQPDNRQGKRPRRRRGPTVSQILAPVLGIGCVFLGVMTGIYYLQGIHLRGQMEEAEIQHQASMAELQQKLDETIASTIPIEDFKANAAAYNVSAEFIQRFFDDVIVYKDDAIIYAPIDPDIPKNDYDWQFLDRSGGHYSYKDDKYTAKLGVDVSKFQNEIDWELVAGDGIRFAMIRMGYRGYGNGALMTDPTFQYNIEGALENGLDVGVYFFSQAVTAAEAIEEAEYLLEAIAEYDVTMPVVFDMEIVTESEEARANSLSPSERAVITEAFCERIAEAGYSPMIYGNPAWLLSKMDWQSLPDYPLWLAQYSREPFFPYEFTMWQYTSTGRVNGIDGDVDLNLCFSSGW